MIKVVSIVGPTASGKTRLSVEIAKKLNGEIVSADSMQIYKGMTIATAAPTEDEKQGIKHHLMEFLSSDKNFSVADYVELAHKAIYNIHKADKLPIVVGGTGLYVDSLLNNIKFTDNSSDIKVREKYTEMLNEYGVSYLLDKLKEIDNISYNRLSKEINAKRIIRALEFYEVTGKTITEQNINSKQDSPYNVIKIGLTCRDRELLYNRINKRIDIMLESGLLEEAEKVLNSDLSETAKKAIGYKELIPYFSGEQSLEECIETLKMNTRRYAKRQLTWFRRDEDINWLYIDEYDSFEDLLNTALKIIITKGFYNGQTSF
ncbi:MAG: tRNA (adenosine(37)-N6)-dimethylallyltransferase MiaA [Ruminococcus sp.]|nr:tRNA (adenosine(37)-N6)-dimethylallyltransferase MiaA [Ruminococcus sp.]